MNPARIHILKEGFAGTGPVVYWMSRDQRLKDNWALVHAQELAIKRKVPLVVVFCLVKNFLGATIRQYGFMLKGLEELERSFREKNIAFYVLTGDPIGEIPRFCEKTHAAILVTDFDPLKIKKHWKEKVSSNISIPFYEVDAHNIVPCLFVSQKCEFSARTIRPKIKKMLPEFLEEFPAVKKHPFGGKVAGPVDWKKIRGTVREDMSVNTVKWILPGERAARKVLKDFLKNNLTEYGTNRNFPDNDVQSGLSPYLHFGQISAQRIALEVLKSEANGVAKDVFLEQLIIRRELSDNYCNYCEDYDNSAGFPKWARKTLSEHRKDRRTYLYSLKEFEEGLTHDELWNAAELEMVKTGKMHGYMRMYWCKKIFEWTKTPEDAQRLAIYLNDKYELDGRDPNGYTGIAWSIGGVHDRAWAEMPVFGKIRYMSYNGARSKFDIKAYIAKNKPANL
ncbi:MAG TPA: deoxyribodipyrimidine photo-lyase [Candidatus Omnitrophota bacterium]|nr:deoxyribodipyrimidine photo-lyase [Candidatus Omnitrophota bacterium]HPS19377.1 deoxyribodipyrimidine photo-lyase [Candidatus Omnitrophota bacterium]